MGPASDMLSFCRAAPSAANFCHNPDTWDLNDPSAHSCTADELLEKARCCRGYWGKKGGITVSGGEPLLQPDFLLELFTKAKAQGVHTCIDTAGHPFTKTEPFFSKFQALMAVTDLLLVDMKQMNPQRHKALTGVTGDNTLELLRYLDEIKKPVWVRHVLVPEWTDFDEDLRAMRAFLTLCTMWSGWRSCPITPWAFSSGKSWGFPIPLQALHRPQRNGWRMRKKFWAVGQLSCQPMFLRGC